MCTAAASRSMAAALAISSGSARSDPRVKRLRTSARSSVNGSAARLSTARGSPWVDHSEASHATNRQSCSPFALQLVSTAIRSASNAPESQPDV